MTETEWQASVEPSAMIDWLDEQGQVDTLWQFTFDCFHHVWDELPGDAFRRVVDHAEEIGTRDLEFPLEEATQALKKLERRFHKATNPTEEGSLNRQIAFARMVFALEQQDVASIANSISSDLVDWSEESDSERRRQATVLRQVVPNIG